MCVLAHEKVCNCHCDGANHGKAKHNKFRGYFCEGCDTPFGMDKDLIWERGCYTQWGTSKKYPGRFVNNTIACWCLFCYQVASTAYRSGERQSACG